MRGWDDISTVVPLPQQMRLGKKDTYISSKVRHILVPLKTCGVVASPYMGRPRPFPIDGHNPHGTDVTKKFEIHI
jgi:hypothetical protein